jgi:hypothetical protein
MVHPKPVKMAAQARVALSEVPMFKRDIRRLICYKKASLEGVPVYEVKDRIAKPAWQDGLADAVNHKSIPVDFSLMLRRCFINLAGVNIMLPIGRNDRSTKMTACN